MEKETGNFTAIITLLYQRTGYDFRGYRPSTLQRRINRRLHATGCSTHETYLDFLSRHPAEYGDLLKNLTIRVTEFFRDPATWEVMKKEIVSRLLNQPKEIRVWSAGCATGEETYSLAIMLKEVRSRNPEVRSPIISILGTDLDDEALRSAREGIYPEERLKFVIPPLRETYFQPTKNGYQIIQKMRDCVDFRAVDLVNGLVGGEFDLISCRNVLIYFSKELQERVLLKFHEALRPGGFLWLGKAESLWGKTQELFTCLDKGAKIFGKLAGGEEKLL